MVTWVQPHNVRLETRRELELSVRDPAAPGRRLRGQCVEQHHLLAPALAQPPGGAPDRSFLPIAGDDAGAKARVSAFLAAIGYGAVDARPLAESWRQEPGTPVHGTTYGPYSDPVGILADEPTVRAAFARASR